ncbi:MAG: tryptophan 2,3-dioxygenase family protein [Cyclobacteriaceae bacterium]
MQGKELSPKILDLITKLQEKHEGVGESLEAHLEGLLYSDYVNYWDYIGIDALLNLQKTKTKYPDEMVFIIYHQITELFFKMILHEIEQIGFRENLEKTFFLNKMNRINAYYDHLLHSFNLLSIGLEAKQFMQFRTALTPASGFQSIQYRLIEVWSTQFKNLLSEEDQQHVSDESDVEAMYENIYWKKGATVKNTAKKTLTLVQFEKKYSKLIVRKGKELADRNILSRYFHLSEKGQKDEEIIAALKQFDQHANINWPMAHYGYANKYLHKGEEVVASTGGTNWKHYLPPHFQRRMFYPTIWSEDEKANWGKDWVEETFLNK